MRTNASNWLELADKIWHYRRDQLTEKEERELRQRTDDLRRSVKARENAAKLKLGIEALEPTLRQYGGAIYPKTALVENVEFFVVAAIVILGFRTYFAQPFKIPTNSMWPTYNGMTPEVWHKPEEAPGAAARVARFILLGASRKEAVATESGPVTAPICTSASGFGGRVWYESKPARSWLIFPTTNREYTFYVNQQPVRLQVPEDFDFDSAFQEATGMNLLQLMQLADNSTQGNGSVRGVTLPMRAEAGKPFLSFDIRTGDQLFVDRVSYHFMRPQVGQGFVFRTDNIHDVNMRDRQGHQIEQYYVKRLVGTPGDTLEVREPVLYRNGKPITGATAFDANAQRLGKYRGYFDAPADRGRYLTHGTTATIPANSFFAMGDNSANSADSRYWGFVPAKDVIGRPLFVYFPFTRHWGPAR